jgi:predicted nucleic acid-binding protein
MTTVVLDASVVLKWVLPSRLQESHTQEALSILQYFQATHLKVLQPPHWLVEATAVLSRIAPEAAGEAIGLLYTFEFPVAGDLEIYRRAAQLASSLQQHVFDTLYHAVALIHPDTVLITADERYYRKSADLGRIVRLREFQLERA